MSEFTLDIEVNLPDVYALVPSAVSPTDVSASVASASALIETVSGVFLKASDRVDAQTPISFTDAVWLRKAIVFQAAWMIEQYGVLGRQAVSSLSQDGLSVSAPDGLTFVLAPLARRALNNCSWAKSGTLKVAVPEAPSVSDFLSDDNHAWSPLGAV